LPKNGDIHPMETRILENEVIAIQVMALAIIVLISLTVYLILSSVIFRFINNRRKARYDAKKEECLPKILDYVFSGSDVDTSSIQTGLKKRSDFIPVLALIYELLDDVEGSETDRIREVLGIKVFREFHRKLLKSSNRDDKIMACRYYSHLKTFDEKEHKSLNRLLSDKSLLVVHSAAVAIMSLTVVARRSEALVATLKRPSISKLAILELLYLYHHTEIDQMDEEAEALLNIIKNEQIPDNHLAILIKGICDIGYVTLADPFFNLIESNFGKNRELVAEALIYAMGNLQYGIATDTILDRYLNDPRPRLRRACAALIELLQDADYAEQLFILAKDPEFSVRVKAIYALAVIGDAGRSILKRLTEQTSELKIMIRNIVAEVDQKFA
jgi:HEAT repeat protein